MIIKVNGTQRNVTMSMLSDILTELGFTLEVATAVNENFVPAKKRLNFKVKQGDRVEILAPMQGG